MSYTCGHCHGSHDLASVALACSRGTAPAAPAAPAAPLPTEKQMRLYGDLCTRKGQRPEPVPATRRLMSDRISYLFTLPDQEVTVPVNTEKLPPLAMLNLVRAGRYAVPSLSHTEYIFVRVARPKTGRRAGQSIVQTRHADAWVERLCYRADGTRAFVTSSPVVKGTDLSDIIISIISDQTTAAMEYATRSGCCARCGKELTDDRSRYFGIGPECEKDWPHFVPMVTEVRGEYVPGAASR